MNAQLAPEDLDTEPAPDGARALLRSVVITDLCDSTAHVDALGDVRATELIRAHDRLLRGLIREHRGQEIDKTDGFLSLFERPIQAVAFALAYQRGLRAFSLDHGVELKARIGVHVGEVMTWQNDVADVAKGAKPTEVEGLAKPVAARLMGMALPGQILLSGVAYTLAHRAEGELGAALSRVQWKAHGDFRFKGVAEAVPVYEIGEEGLAPFKAPAWSGKAHREVPLWRRPAMLAFEVIALLLAVALPAWHFLTPAPAIAFAERDWVVLADLRNLTGDPRFDDSLEQAFRIGLEQSRHVNVLSDLQVRDTLQRMQRDSDAPVDRSTGAEIAVREGARALVLPTLAEVGGRLRFTAELIHPNTQATVYSEYADGRGVEAVLPLVDEVNRKLRERLGEAVAQVEADSQPLEKVATADMDALRAYSRAIALLDARQTEDGRALMQRAIQIDPGFARAHLDLGVSHFGGGDAAVALGHFEESLRHDSRLAEREQKYAAAMLQSARSGGESALELWRTLHLAYPDYFAASGAYAWFLWTSKNVYSESIEVLHSNVSERNPRRGTGLYLLGALHLGLGNVDAAGQWLNEASDAGARFENRILAALPAMGRDYVGAVSILNANSSDTLFAREVKEIARASFLADQGDVSGAMERLASVRQSTNSDRGQRIELSLSLLALELNGVDAQSEGAPELEVIARSWPSKATVDSVDLVAAWRLSRGGQFDREALSVLMSKPRQQGYEISQRLALVEAQQSLADGQPTAALERLLPLVDGSELIALRRLAIEASFAAEDWEAAETHAAHLAGLRGRAYVEPMLIETFLPLNAYWASTALLDLAEAQAHQGKQGESSQSLKRFKDEVKAWPQHPRLRERVGALDSTPNPDG